MPYFDIVQFVELKTVSVMYFITIHTTARCHIVNVCGDYVILEISLVEHFHINFHLISVLVNYCSKLTELSEKDGSPIFKVCYLISDGEGMQIEHSYMGPLKCFKTTQDSR